MAIGFCPRPAAPAARRCGSGGNSDAGIARAVRAGAERVAALAPALRDLGVDHLLVDPPATLDPRRLGDEVSALRAAVDG